MCRCTLDARSANLRSCNWCPVACPRHTLRMFATEGEKEREATPGRARGKERKRERRGTATAATAEATVAKRRVKDEGDRLAKKRERSKKQKEGGGMRGSRRRSCRR